MDKCKCKDVGKNVDYFMLACVLEGVVSSRLPSAETLVDISLTLPSLGTRVTHPTSGICHSRLTPCTRRCARRCLPEVGVLSGAVGACVKQEFEIHS